MDVIHLNNTIYLNEPLVLTIGQFDGIHKAHQELIKKTVLAAKNQNAKSAVITFLPHIDSVIKGTNPNDFIIDMPSKIEILNNLNVDYFNINLLVEIPILLPSYVTRCVLAFIMDVCKTFELEIYYEGIKNIEPFDITGLMMFMEKEKMYFIEEHPEYEIFFEDREKLTQICQYQQMMPYLPSKIKDEAVINPYIVMNDNDYKKIVYSIHWVAGTATVFPPHLDYVHVEEDGVVSIIPAPIFFKYCHKYMYELRDYMPNAVLLLLCGRNVNRAKKTMKKARKDSVPHTLFTNKKLINVVEK